MVRRAIAISATVIATAFSAGSANASLILNGSFEDNSAVGTVFSPSNAALNALLSNFAAFGAREGIDLQTVGSGFGSAPIDGLWKVSPASDSGGASEAFSLTLSVPLSIGLSYVLSFYVEPLSSPPFNGGTVEIGISTSASTFGTVVDSATAPATGWELHTSSFVAPLAGGYLTVRLTTSQNSWVGLDNFVLNASTAAVAEPGALALVTLGLAGFALGRRRVSRRSLRRS